jgi:hypothetical protein
LKPAALRTGHPPQHLPRACHPSRCHASTSSRCDHSTHRPYLFILPSMRLMDVIFLFRANSCCIRSYVFRPLAIRHLSLCFPTSRRYHGSALYVGKFISCVGLRSNGSEKGNSTGTHHRMLAPNTPTAFDTIACTSAAKLRMISFVHC